MLARSAARRANGTAGKGLGGDVEGGRIVRWVRGTAEGGVSAALLRDPRVPPLPAGDVGGVLSLVALQGRDQTTPAAGTGLFVARVVAIAIAIGDSRPVEGKAVRAALPRVSAARRLLGGQRDPALLRGAPDRPRLEFQEDAGAAWRDSISILGFKTEYSV